jgi:hypothetical protein
LIILIQCTSSRSFWRNRKISHSFSWGDTYGAIFLLWTPIWWLSLYCFIEQTEKFRKVHHLCSVDGYSRILPSISFFLQIYLVQRVFSLNLDCHRAFIYALYILSIFTFTSMIISIFWSSCYHGFITYGLLVTGGLLSVLSCYNFIRHDDERILTSSPRGNKVVAVHTSGTNNKLKSAWQELPWIKKICFFCI